MNLFCSGLGWQFYWKSRGNYTDTIRMSNENQFKKDIAKLNYSVFVKRRIYY